MTRKMASFAWPACGNVADRVARIPACKGSSASALSVTVPHGSARRADAQSRCNAVRSRVPCIGIRYARCNSARDLLALMQTCRARSPSPLTWRNLPLYIREQGRRHDVRTGITGWTQVNGRNAISWRTSSRWTWYVDHRSIWLDPRILWRPLGRVMKRDGISHGTDDTMPWFTGFEGCDG